MVNVVAAARSGPRRLPAHLLELEAKPKVRTSRSIRRLGLREEDQPPQNQKVEVGLAGLAR